MNNQLNQYSDLSSMVVTRVIAGSIAEAVIVYEWIQVGIQAMCVVSERGEQILHG